MTADPRRDLTSDDLIVSYMTLAGSGVGQPARWGFLRRVRAAAQAGFSAIGMSTSDFEACRDIGMSAGQLGLILDDHGLQVAEIEGIWDWMTDGPRGLASARLERILCEMSEVFGPRYVTAIDLNPPGSDYVHEQVVDSFGKLCDRMSAAGTAVALEFLPWTSIPDVTAACAIVSDAGRANGGLLIDAWHHFHGPGTLEDLSRVPVHSILGVQLSDATLAPAGDLFTATMHRRFPGQGELDLKAFVCCLERAGVRVPIAVEVIHPDLATRSVEEVAGEAFRTARSVIEVARKGCP